MRLFLYSEAGTVATVEDVFILFINRVAEGIRLPYPRSVGDLHHYQPTAFCKSRPVSSAEPIRLSHHLELKNFRSSCLL